jgi:hypothetical protein
MLMMLICWASCRLARWERLDEPTRSSSELNEGIIMKVTPQMVAHCWSFDFSVQRSIPPEAALCESQVTTLADNRWRFILAFLAGPSILLQTVLHWFSGRHCPLTSSRSFYLVNTGSEMPTGKAKITMWTLLFVPAAGLYFFYCGLWVVVLLFMRLHDCGDGFERFQLGGQLIMCCFGLLTKAGPMVASCVLYAAGLSLASICTFPATWVGFTLLLAFCMLARAQQQQRRAMAQQPLPAATDPLASFAVLAAEAG